MLLSIITINYNNKAGLEKTIESVLSQSNIEFEYIIIDGGSADGSVDIIKKYSDKITLWVSEKDKGIYDAINKGINYSNGEYLMFLNSGDILTSSSSISHFFNQVKNDPVTDIFYGDIECTINTRPDSWIHKHPEKLILQFLEHNNINHQSSFIKSKLFKELGLYNLNYRLASDHWFYLKAFISDKVFTHIDFPLVKFNYDGAGSINRSLYELEMADMWDKLVPKYVKIMLESSKLNNEQISFLKRIKVRLGRIKRLL